MKCSYGISIVIAFLYFGEAGAQNYSDIASQRYAESRSESLQCYREAIAIAARSDLEIDAAVKATIDMCTTQLMRMNEDRCHSIFWSENPLSKALADTFSSFQNPESACTETYLESDIKGLQGYAKRRILEIRYPAPKDGAVAK